MSERKKYDQKLVEIGTAFMRKRKALGKQYSSRESFIEERGKELFGGEPWISPRYLASVEEGKNMISVEMLIKLAYALEENPSSLFREILRIYTS